MDSHRGLGNRYSGMELSDSYRTPLEGLCEHSFRVIFNHSYLRCSLCLCIIEYYQLTWYYCQQGLGSGEGRGHAQRDADNTIGEKGGVETSVGSFLS